MITGVQEYGSKLHCDFADFSGYLDEFNELLHTQIDIYRYIVKPLLSKR